MSKELIHKQIDIVINQKTGQRLKFLAKSNDKTLMLEARSRYPAGLKEPPKHYHPFQSEYFRVLEGSIRVSLDGKVFDLEKGEQIDIPPGQIHSM